jgi:hypothetical protein
MSDEKKFHEEKIAEEVIKHLQDFKTVFQKTADHLMGLRDRMRSSARVNIAPSKSEPDNGLHKVALAKRNADAAEHLFAAQQRLQEARLHLALTIRELKRDAIAEHDEMLERALDHFGVKPGGES